MRQVAVNLAKKNIGTFLISNGVLYIYLVAAPILQLDERIDRIRKLGEQGRRLEQVLNLHIIEDLSKTKVTTSMIANKTVEIKKTA